MPFLPCSLHEDVEIGDAALTCACDRADLFLFHTGLDCFSWQSVRNHLGFLTSCDEPRAHLGMNGLIGQNARWVTSKFLLEFLFTSIHELKSCFLCSLLGRHLPIAFDDQLSPTVPSSRVQGFTPISSDSRVDASRDDIVFWDRFLVFAGCGGSGSSIPSVFLHTSDAVMR